MNKKELNLFIIIGVLSLLLGLLFGAMSGIKTVKNANEKSAMIEVEKSTNELTEEPVSIKSVNGKYFVIDKLLYPSTMINNNTSNDLSYITFNIIIYYKNGNITSNNSYTTTPIPSNTTTYVTLEPIKISGSGEIEKVEMQMENAVEY